jgi:hypothetical protein
MTYERPIESRYLDPVELVWLSAAERMGITLRRDPTIFSRTDGSGMLWLGPRDDLDPDDTLAQMMLHEICHWITNGVDSYHQRDWGFPLDAPNDPREYACLRLQAALADEVGLRGMFGPTGEYREYFDRLKAPVEPVDTSPEEAEIVRLAGKAMDRAAKPPFAPHLQQAMQATRAIADIVRPWLTDYATELEEDTLPSLWSRT